MRDGVENHLGDIEVTFTVRFPDGEAGDRARERLPRAIEQSRDRLCTVSRTVQRGAPIDDARGLTRIGDGLAASSSGGRSDRHGARPRPARPSRPTTTCASPSRPSSCCSSCRSSWSGGPPAGCLQPSISAYYYTPVGAVFIGVLVTMGVCLVALKGNTDGEDVLMNLAGMLAPGVAFIPTPDAGTCRSAPLATLRHPEHRGQQHAGALRHRGCRRRGRAWSSPAGRGR